MENKIEKKKMPRRVYGGRWEAPFPFVNRLRQNAAKEQMRLRLKAAKEAEGGSDKAEGGSDKAEGGSDKAEGGSDKAESEGASNRNDDDDDSESCTDEEEEDDDVEDDDVVEDDDDEEYDDDEDPEKRYMEDVSVGYMLGNMIMSSIVQREARDSGK